MNHLIPLGHIIHDDNDNSDSNKIDQSRSKHFEISNSNAAGNTLFANNHLSQLDSAGTGIAGLTTVDTSTIINNNEVSSGMDSSLQSAIHYTSSKPSHLSIHSEHGEEFTSQITGDDITPMTKKVRKRAKLTKSCNFCRRRKLKCDHARPICSSCKCRGLNECIYSYQPPSSTPLDACKSRRPTRHISEDNRTGTAKTVLSSSKNVKNPFKDHYYLESKPDGRYIMYGPTSIRTYIMKSNWGFLDKFQQLWSKVEVERDAWKERHKEVGVSEVDLLNYSSEEDSSWNLNGIISSLPEYDSILESIMEFTFPLNNDLYEMNTFIDSAKLLRDFLLCFIKDEDTGKVCRLKPGVGKNYFKIGVILMILSFVRFKNSIPDNIERFFIYLTGLSSSEAHYIERVQFLLLRCFYVEMYLSDEDKTESITLIDLACSAAVSMGLHLNIRELYANRQDVVGCTTSIENLWSWILYFDTTLAIHNGKPLNIGVETFNGLNFEEEEEEKENRKTDELTVYETSFKPKMAMNFSQDLGIPTDLRNLEDSTYRQTTTGSELSNGAGANTGRVNTRSRNLYAINYETDKSFFGKLRRLLAILRPMVSEFYEDYGVPDVIQFSMKLLRFMEDEFLSVNYFTDPTLISRVPVGDIRLLVSILSTAATFLVLSFTKLNLRKNYVKNICIHLQFLLFTMFKNYTRYCYEIDKRRFPDTIDPGSNEFPPYLNSAIPLFKNEIQKALTMTFSLIYLKATLFKRGIFLLSDMVDVDWDLSTLKTPMEKNLTLLAGARIVVKIFDDWLGVGSTNEDDIRFRSVLKRFYPFLSIIALEGAYRTVIEQAIEYRKKTERMWIELHSNPADSGDTSVTNNSENKSKFEVDDAAETCDNVPVGSTNGQTVTLQRNSLEQLQDDSSRAMQYSQQHFRQLLFDKPIIPRPIEPRISDPPGIESPFSATGSDSSSMESPNQLAQELADEFWSSYNAGWEELIQQKDIFSVFHDLP